MDGWSILNTVRQQTAPSVDLTSAGFRLTDVSAEALTEATPVSSTGTDVRELPKSPADPRYRYRIPPPACAKCGNDHLPNRSYDHPWSDGQPQEAPVETNGVAYAQSTPNSAYVPQGRRVAIYDGRTGYVVKVEEAPDWDDVAKIKMDANTLKSVLPLLRALKVKIKNNSEDFDELEESSPRRVQRTASPLSREGFERACAELGLDPEQVRTAGISGGDGPTADGFADAAHHEQGDSAEGERE